MLVDGRVVLRHGRLERVDEASLLEAARAAHARRGPEMDRLDRLVDELRPAYERIHRRARVGAIAADTYAARLEG